MPGLVFEIPTFPTAASVKTLFKSLSRPSTLSLNDPALHHLRESQQKKVARNSQQQEQEQEEPCSRFVISENPRSPETLKQDESKVITEILHYLESKLAESHSENSSSVFCGNKLPSISLHAYLERIVKYANSFSQDQASSLSSGIRCLLLTVELLDRSSIVLTPLAIHRYLIATSLVCIKTQEDFPISNKFWAQVGGIQLDDLNNMERAICHQLGFSLHVTKQQFLSRQLQFGVFCDV